MNISRVGLVAVATISLAACNGGVINDELSFFTGPQSFGGAGSGAITEAQLNEILDELDAFWAALANNQIDVLPVTQATATVNGVIFVDALSAPDEAIAGNLTLNANFTSRTVGGSASDFGIYSGDNEAVFEEALGGTLAITNGIMDADHIFSADMTGILNGSTGNTTVDADMDGFFADVNGTVMAGGSVTGTLNNDTDGVSTISDAVFIAFE